MQLKLIKTKQIIKVCMENNHQKMVCMENYSYGENLKLLFAKHVHSSAKAD